MGLRLGPEAYPDMVNPDEDDHSASDPLDKKV